MLIAVCSQKCFLNREKPHSNLVNIHSYCIDVFGPLPATRGMAQAQAEEGDREPQKTERSGDSRIIPECTAMSGTAWEARLFLSDMERAGGGGRGRAMCAPPPS